MKSLNTILSVAFLIGTFASTNAQVAEKTLVKSFNLKGQQVVVLDLEGDVDVQTWKNDIMRIQMKVAIPNIHTATLKSLLQAGRYNLKSKVGEDDITVFAPALNKEIKIGGQLLKEKVNYLVYAPEDVIVKLANEASTSQLSAGDKSPSSL